MKLLKLLIENFKGFDRFEIAPDAEDLNIYGENATGKTTIPDAFYWLLWGKDSQDQANFDIKPLNAQGDVKNHGAETSVTAHIEYNGEIIELKKTLQEKWTKKRGASSPVFDGHDTGYYIDGVPVKAKDYEAGIARICDAEVFKLLTNPLYFGEKLHWRKRRDILFEIVGDLTEREVIESSKILLPLLDIKGKHDVNSFRIIATKKRADLNKELDKIPVKVNELVNQLNYISGDIDPEAEKAALDILDRTLAKPERELQELINGQIDITLRNKLTEIRNQIMALDNENTAYKNTQRQEYMKSTGEGLENIRVQQRTLQERLQDMCLEEKRLSKEELELSARRSMLIDPSIVQEAALHFESAKVFLEGLE